MKVHLEAKQSEKFLEDYVIITSLTLWGIETATSSFRVLTPKTLNFRKYKNRWRWRLEFKIRESESTRTLLCWEVALSLCFLTMHLVPITPTFSIVWKMMFKIGIVLLQNFWLGSSAKLVETESLIILFYRLCDLQSSILRHPYQLLQM